MKPTPIDNSTTPTAGCVQSTIKPSKSEQINGTNIPRLLKSLRELVRLRSPILIILSDIKPPARLAKNEAKYGIDELSPFLSKKFSDLEAFKKKKNS